MNKLISFILTLIFLIPSFSYADSPSIGDLIGEILEGDNSYKSYLHVAKSETGTCAECAEKNQIYNKPIDKEAFYQGWKLNCVALNGSQLCEGLKEEDKLLCNAPPKTPWYSNVWEKTKACGAGIKKSWTDFFHFMQEVGNYIVNKDIEVKNANGTTKKVGTRTNTNQQISKAWSSMTSYMAMETTKYQDKYHVSSSKAFLAVTGNMMKKFTAGLNSLIAQVAPKVGCYNYKAKTRVICQVLAEFFADPILMFKFIKLGPKVLKGTRIAKFFEFHKGQAVKKIALTASELSEKSKSLVTSSKSPLLKIDFIQEDSKVVFKIMENPKLNNAIASNKKIFEDVFPDKKALDELDLYLKSTSKQESDELAEVFRILGEDKKNMSKEQYKDIVEDIKKSIKNSCEM